MNQIVQDIHLAVGNPYTLLTSLKEKPKWCTVLDLKDAFFCIPLDKDSQAIFAFEWESPTTGCKTLTYFTWTVLPQGFRSSPTIFGNQLAKELEVWKTENSERIILQYVDDILIAAETWEDCLQATISLLNFLGQAGYQVSKSKAHTGKETVIYLGFEILQGQRRLGAGRQEAMCQIPEPRTIRELRTFLGMVGWCQLWVLSYGLLVRPLYEALKGSQENQLLWTPECQTAFKNLKKALTSAPVLGLPDLAKPFELFQLDNVSKGWPGCLRAVAATVLLIQEARKLTMGQKIMFYVPHMVISVLEQKGGHWLSPRRMLKYQVTLLEQDDVELKTTTVVNPAMFLSLEVGESLHHDCLQAIGQVYSSRQDLKDKPLPNPDLELFTDGSSFAQYGK
ncbi:hypothetical protein QYF61_010180 [Mycteria americana]|uniref:ribonuclease H n=1 Tax=Mycteria americana TaxID=33587 RepID=A0AAN7MTT2_MYCAM|nr:hypothetical protein QYF61_010180 [Mycteria americana]